jgi:hypothetical protein
MRVKRYQISQSRDHGGRQPDAEILLTAESRDILFRLQDGEDWE